MREWKMTRFEYFAAEAMKQLIHEHYEYIRSDKHAQELCPVTLTQLSLSIANEMDRMAPTSPDRQTA